MLSPRSHILLPSGFFALFLSLVVSFSLFRPLWFYTSCCLLLYILFWMGSPFLLLFCFNYFARTRKFILWASVGSFSLRLGFRLFTLETSLGSDKKNIYDAIKGLITSRPQY